MAGVTEARNAAAAPALTWQQKLWREVKGYAEALVIAYLVVTFLFTTVGVVGTSMEPNLDGGSGNGDVLQALLTGDRVFIPKFDTWLRRAGVLGEYERGAVVVLREPENSLTSLVFDQRKFFIKRVIGVPGDRVRIEAGQVYVNGAPLDQGFIEERAPFEIEPQEFPRVLVEDGRATALSVRFDRVRDGVYQPILPRAGEMDVWTAVDDPRVRLFYGEVVDNLVVPAGAEGVTAAVLDFEVPADSYFVMGDNRGYAGSEDSRVFGPVDAMAIAGRATAVIWPPRRGGEWNFRTLPAPPFADTAAATASTM